MAAEGGNVALDEAGNVCDIHNFTFLAAADLTHRWCQNTLMNGVFPLTISAPMLGYIVDNSSPGMTILCTH